MLIKSCNLVKFCKLDTVALFILLVKGDKELPQGIDALPLFSYSSSF